MRNHGCACKLHPPEAATSSFNSGGAQSSCFASCLLLQLCTQNCVCKVFAFATVYAKLFLQVVLQVVCLPLRVSRQDSAGLRARVSALIGLKVSC